MKILKKGVLYDDLRKLYGQTLGYKIKYFCNVAMKEYPEIVAATPLALIGLVLGMYSQRLRSKQPKEPKYYNAITIYRPNDPRVAFIRKDETLREVEER
ncbi:uncharacterized protein LOC143148280 [Ptiloglossa arizonensis]|uniref:uncharacterized protein LOC143148280 n=1 Tax=Ptiloglossa arizonensis TaxID=3350558 RepID=UPI003FA16661